MKLIQLLDGSQVILSNDPKSFEELLLDKLGLEAAQCFCEYLSCVESLKQEIDILEDDNADLQYNADERLDDLCCDVGNVLDSIESEIEKCRQMLDLV